MLDAGPKESESDQEKNSKKVKYTYMKDVNEATDDKKIKKQEKLDEVNDVKKEIIEPIVKAMTNDENSEEDFENEKRHLLEYDSFATLHKQWSHSSAMVRVAGS